MAKATVNPEVTETQTVVTAPASITLTLSIDEAKAVRMLFGYVAGDLTYGVYDEVDEALNHLGHRTSLHQDDGLKVERGHHSRPRVINSP